MTGRYHAYIINDHGDFKVRPAIATVDSQPRDRPPEDVAFTVRNLTDYTARISFPDERPVAKAWAPSRKNGGVIGAGSVGIIRLERGRTGLFWYEVYLRTSSKTQPAVKARGESGPGMIIDP